MNISTVKFKNLVWLNITDPTEKEIEYLRKKYRFHALDLEDCLSENERPKIDEYEKYLFLILHFPVLNKRTNRIETEELDIFIGPKYLITIHHNRLKPLMEMFEGCQKSLRTRKSLFSAGTGYLFYQMIDAVFDYCFPLLDNINSEIKELEKDIFEEVAEKDSLYDIMSLKRKIINFERIIVPQRPVIVTLEHKHKSFLPENMEVYFDDVVDKIEKIWNTLKTHKEVVDALGQANESMISHNINNVMKILTIFSVIMLPLTFLTGLYGMNVMLPLDRNPDTFWMMIGLMGLVVVTMLVVFRWKKWL